MGSARTAQRFVLCTAFGNLEACLHYKWQLASTITCISSLRAHDINLLMFQTLGIEGCIVCITGKQSEFFLITSIYSFTTETKQFYSYLETPSQLGILIDLKIN